MYTSLIAGALLYIVLTCIFRNSTNGNIKLIIGSVAVFATIVALVITTQNRKDSLETFIATDTLGITASVYKVDTIHYKIDTVKTKDNTNISKVKTEKNWNHTEYKKHAVHITKKAVNDSVSEYFIITKDEDEIPISDIKIVVSAKTLFVEHTENYMPDKWTAWIMPSKDSWYELQISQKDLDKIKSVYPSSIL